MISSSATNNLILDQNRKISNLTLSSKTIDLNGYSLTVYGTATMTSGTVTNGTFYARGNLAAFNGTLMDCPVDADCGYIRFSGSTFNSTVTATDQGVATGTGAGGCTFNDDVTIIHGGNGTYFTLANTTGDVFNADLTVINYSSHEVHLSNTSSTQYKGNLMLSSTGTGGITFGNSGGTSTLDSGKTITIGSTGFTNDVLLLKNFTQLGNTAQILTLTGTAVASFNGSTFNGEITVSSPGILLKNSIFNGMSSFTKIGTSNAQSDGGNVFNYATTISNTGASGRIRMATVNGDTYNADATFNSTGQDVQIGYSGDNTFAGNITINSNKVVFNTSTGKVTFTGTNNQTLNGSYNYPFKKLAINKTAGTVTANTTLSVDDSLLFIQGNLITTSTNLLTMKHGSTANGASNSSFVSGPVKKVGNSAFVFDVGSGNTYRPLTITAPTNTSDAFTAEYYNAGQTLGSTKDTTITFVSDCGYWKLDRNVGSSNITLKFAFDSLHCDYLSVKPVHIALWNGIKWTDKGEAVSESNNKTTSSSMTSYGYFAFAYDLKPGDAPQMPYPLTIGSTCTSVELQFTSHDIWFSFTPDSAVVKGRFSSPDTSKTYAYIKNAIIYNAYQVGDTLETVNVKSWTFDSLLVEFQSYFAVLTPSTDYLLKVTKFDETDGPGVYDSLDYFINFCLFNLRMSSVPQFLEYSDGTDIFNYLGTLGTPGSAFDGDIIIPSSNADNVIDITNFVGTDPLIVEDGITFCGNYDLFSEEYTVNILGDIRTINTSPIGTLIHRTNRGVYLFPPDPDAGLQPGGYVFFMMPRSEIRNIRLRGAMRGFQDYNIDWALCGGIKTFKGTSSLNGPFMIQNCEIFNFSYAGIFVTTPTEDCNMIRNYIHHINGSGGATSAKGYATWIQGPKNKIPLANSYMLNSIFDDSKEAIDAQSNSVNLNISDCTFGRFFNNEAIVRHNQGGWIFEYPDIINPLFGGDPCAAIPPSVGRGTVPVTDVAEGNFTLNKGIFHQTEKNITFPFPYRESFIPNPALPTIPEAIYNIALVNNVFTEHDALPGSFNCNLGGYARIADNYINEPIWDWAKSHDVNSNLATSLPPIILNTPNSFSYQPGVSTNSGTCVDCPQPPEVKIGISPIHGYVTSYLSNEPIPFVNKGSNITITTRQDNVGQPNVTFIVRPKTNNGLSSGVNNSSDNAFNSSEIVTAPCAGTAIPCTTSTTFTSTPTPSNPYWDTSKPGLYGIDAYAVDRNNKYQSKMDHFPFIIAPGSLETHRLIFNIKDSYYADLYGTSGTPTEIYKQVELNGQKIWNEDIASGGDDWEYVIIDLFDPSIAPYLDTRNFKNTITFSIAIENNCTVSSVDHRGLRVWVDDVYLQGKDGIENLMKDGSIENSTASGLSTAPTNKSLWYIKNSYKFKDCFSLDQKYPPSPANAEPAGTEATIAFNERRSGSKSIEIKLDGIHNIDFGGTSCSTYCDLTLVNPLPSPMFPDPVISAAFDFDFRDFLDCDDLTTLPLVNKYESYPPVDAGPYTDRNFIVTSNISVSTADLVFNGCQLAIQNITPTCTITVGNNKTLELLASSTNSTKIFGCTEMWGGLVVQPTGTLKIEGVNARRTEIHDALTGVYNNGGTSLARFAVFDHNYIGMHFENGSHFDPSPMTTEGISGVEFKCSGGEIKLPPYLGESSYAHILLENVTDIRIGGINAPNPGGIANSFSDAVYGIKSTNSQARIFNSEFMSINSNIVGPLNCTFCGSCIYFENTDNIDRDLIIGGPIDVSNFKTEYLKNNFNNSKNGIIVRGDQSVLIQSNEFIDLYQGIRCNRNMFDVTINEENNFSDLKFGITLFNVRNNILIDGNIFNDPKDDYENLSFSRTAISIHNSYTIPTNLVNITNNEISEYRIGIHGLNSPITSISGNIIQFNLSNSLTNYHGGIWLQNCPAAFVSDNDISNTEFLPDLNFRGIDIENSLNCDINCNNIENLGVAINFDGHCDDSELRQNTMSGFDIGININNALIDLFQGTPAAPSSQTAWNNIWSTDPGYSYKVGGSTIGQMSINWFHQFADDIMEPYSPNPFQGLIVNPEDGQNSASITCASTLVNSGSRVEEFGPIVGDSISYEEYAEENTYLARTVAYHAMKLDSTIIYQGDSLDADFEAFFERHDSTNIGKFYLVKSLFEREPDSAMVILGDIVAENSIESHLIEHYVRTQEITDRGGELSSADSAFYMERTNGLPTTDGAVYYYGLGNLFMEQHIPIISARIGQQPIIEQFIDTIHNKSELIIFPNPTSGLLTVRLLDQKAHLYQVEIYNAFGELIISKHIVNNHYLLDMSPYNQGIYFIRAVDQSKKYYTKSFNLLK